MITSILYLMIIKMVGHKRIQCISFLCVMLLLNHHIINIEAKINSENLFHDFRGTNNRENDISPSSFSFSFSDSSPLLQLPTLEKLANTNPPSGVPIEETSRDDSNEPPFNFDVDFSSNNGVNGFGGSGGDLRALGDGGSVCSVIKLIIPKCSLW